MNATSDHWGNDDQLDELLRRAVVERTNIPQALTPRIERQWNRLAWRRRIGLSTALAISLMGLWAASKVMWPTLAPELNQEKVMQPIVKAIINVKPSIRFSEDSHVIAVPVPSELPNATIVMVYPKVRTN